MLKILSLLPSATEIVFALGLGDQLEGVTYECDFPAEARHKSVVSTTALPTGQALQAGDIDRLVGEFMDRREPIYQLDKGLIQRIQPDLILAQDLCRVCAVPSGQVEDALAELGCSAEVVSLDPTTMDDILDGIVIVGRATGRESGAQELVSGLRQRVERVRDECAGLPSVRTLALEWSDPPFVAGHWIPGMVELAGGANLFNADRVPSRKVPWSEIAAASPEVIVFMPCGYSLEQAKIEAEALFDVPDFSGTPAARRSNVLAVDASSYFSRPGPRIVDGLEVLAWAIHPREFPEPPTGRIARVKR
jgi:iron complex transport system substrate-binding protein